jgi:hypothetical protein
MVSFWSVDDAGNKLVTWESNAEVAESGGPLLLEL